MLVSEMTVSPRGVSLARTAYHVNAAPQSRHKAYLRGSSKVLEALAVGAPKSLEDLAVVPAKRRALLDMLPAIRHRHRFHLQVRLPGIPVCAFVLIMCISPTAHDCQ